MNLMLSVNVVEPPVNSALNHYVLQPTCYTDCYFVDVPAKIVLSEFIAAFFNTPLFRLERLMLASVASKPTSAKDVTNIAEGKSDVFAVWSGECRDEYQLLMSVADGPIRSWWMVSPKNDNQEYSRLYFGSVYLPKSVSSVGEPKMGAIFHIFLSFHKLYSRTLLWLAKRELKK